MNKTYVFDLIQNDEVLDSTGLSECNIRLATELFLDEFGWRDKLSPIKEFCVELSRIEEDDDE